MFQKKKWTILVAMWAKATCGSLFSVKKLVDNYGDE